MLKRTAAYCAVSVALGIPDIANAQLARDPIVSPELAKGLIENIGAKAALLWVLSSSATDSNEVNPNAYVRLAETVNRRTAENRALSNSISADFSLAAAAMSTAAAIDVEPASRLSLSLAAYGTQKAGDYISNWVLEEANKQTMRFFVSGLQQQNIDPNSLFTMSDTELRRTIEETRVGQIKMLDTLKEQRMKEAATSFILDDVRKWQGATINAVRGQGYDIAGLQRSHRELTDRQNRMARGIDELEKRATALENGLQETQANVRQLKVQVARNEHFSRALAQISYSGWTTGQKLDAVRRGLLPELGDSGALISQLEAELRREEQLRDFQRIARDASNLSSIASNLGLPTDVVNVFGAAQSVSNAAAQFLAGDTLGAVASITGLLRIGKPDGASVRHHQVMEALQKGFEQVYKRLDAIISLQRRTLEGLATISEQVELLRQDLQRVEFVLWQNTAMLKRLVLQQWDDCAAIGGALSIELTRANERIEVESREVLLASLSDSQFKRHIMGCRNILGTSLDRWINLGGLTKGEMVAAAFRADELVGDSDAKAYIAQINQLQRSYYSVRSFLIERFFRSESDRKLISPALLATRFAQPQISAVMSSRFTDSLKASALRGFQCWAAVGPKVSFGMNRLICFGQPRAKPSLPQVQTFESLIRSEPLGPLVSFVINSGVVVSTFLNFVDDADNFATRSEIEGLLINGPTGTLKAAIEARGRARKNGEEELLDRLLILADAYIFQQAMVAGDYTVELLLDVLYDDKTRSLKTGTRRKAEDDIPEIERLALEALRQNPMLARNVVMAAMRRNREAAGDRWPTGMTNYARSVAQFVGLDACRRAPLAVEKMSALFPNWEFEFRAREDERGTDAKPGPLKDCKLAERSPELDRPFAGSGLSVPMRTRHDKKDIDFYVLVPSPLALATGTYEYPASLLNAIFLRDRVTQAIAVRDIGRDSAILAELDANPKLAIEVLNSMVQYSQYGSDVKRVQPAIVRKLPDR